MFACMMDQWFVNHLCRPELDPANALAQLSHILDQAGFSYIAYNFTQDYTTVDISPSMYDNPEETQQQYYQNDVTEKESVKQQGNKV